MYSAQCDLVVPRCRPLINNLHMLSLITRLYPGPGLLDSIGRRRQQLRARFSVTNTFEFDTKTRSGVPGGLALISAMQF